MVRFDLWPLLQGQTRIAKLESAYITCLLLVLEVWDGKPTSGKSWAGILLVWTDLTFDLAAVTLSLKILSRLYLGNRKV